MLDGRGTGAGEGSGASTAEAPEEGETVDATTEITPTCLDVEAVVVGATTDTDANGLTRLVTAVPSSKVDADTGTIGSDE